MMVQKKETEKFRTCSLFFFKKQLDLNYCYLHLLLDQKTNFKGLFVCFFTMSHMVHNFLIYVSQGRCCLEESWNGWCWKAPLETSSPTSIDPKLGWLQQVAQGHVKSGSEYHSKMEIPKLLWATFFRVWWPSHGKSS